MGVTGMAASEAQKQAYEKYASTPEGIEARREAVRRYQDTPEGREKMEAAKKRYESKLETKVKKAEWARNRYHRIKGEKQNLENSD
jgi:hypothetical protein